MQLPDELTPTILDANPALLTHKRRRGCMFFFFFSFQLSRICAYPISFSSNTFVWWTRWCCSRHILFLYSPGHLYHLVLLMHSSTVWDAFRIVQVVLSSMHPVCLFFSIILISDFNWMCPFIEWKVTVPKLGWEGIWEHMRDGGDDERESPI